MSPKLQQFQVDGATDTRRFSVCKKPRCENAGASPHRASIPSFMASSDAPVPFVLGREVLKLTCPCMLLLILLHKSTSNEDRTLRKQIQVLTCSKR